MKTNSHWLLNTIRVVLTAIWYVNMALIVIAFGMLTWKFCTSEYVEFDGVIKTTQTFSSPFFKVQRPAFPSSSPETIKLSSLTPHAKGISFSTDQYKVRMNLRNTPGYIATAYFFLISFELLVMIIIYQLRRFFDALKNTTPFQYDNIYRLKTIALCFVLFNGLHVLLGVSTSMILNTYIKNVITFNTVWEENFTGLILGAVVYIMADVFKYGFTLQKENGEFV